LATNTDKTVRRGLVKGLRAGKRPPLLPLNPGKNAKGEEEWRGLKPNEGQEKGLMEGEYLSLGLGIGGGQRGKMVVSLRGTGQIALRGQSRWRKGCLASTGKSFVFVLC